MEGKMEFEEFEEKYQKLTSEEQVKSIVNMENNNDVQVVFAGRGEEAKKLLNR